MKTKILPLIAVFMIISFEIFAQSITLPTGATAVNCGNILYGESSSGTHSFTFSASGMSAGQEIFVDVASSNPDFTISKTSGSGFVSSLSYICDGFGELGLQTVYVQFTPSVRGQQLGYFIDLANDDFSVVEAQRVRGGGITPEVKVDFNNIEILDGSVTTGSSDSTDFGSTNISGSTTDVTYTISNIAGVSSYDGDLKLNGTPPNFVTISGSSDFTVLSQPSLTTIARNGGSTTFTIRFDPSSTGIKNATVSFANNDLSENPYNFAITGNGVVALPVVSSTNSVINITNSTGSSGGNIASGDALTNGGICWNTSSSPTISNNHTSGVTGTGPFSSHSLTSLGSGTLYYVRAYATNSTGTAYGPEQTFYTLSSEPTANGSALTVDSKTSSSMNLSWTSGTGEDGYIILKKQGATPPTVTGIVDGVKHTSFSLPIGTEVVGEVAEPTHTITASGLNAETQYSYLVIAFARDGHDDTYNYKTDNTSTVTATTVAAAPTVQASNIVWGTPAAGSMEFSWNSGNGAGVIFLMKASGAPANPVNGTSYTSNTVFGSAPNLGDGTRVVYFGAASKGNITVTGLTNGVNYFFKVLGYNGTGGDISYNMTETGGHNVGNSEDSYLPISLVSFDVSLVNNKALVEWKTSSEKDNDYFTIEKSTNLLEWNTVSIVKGAGNSNNMISYRLLDENPSNGFSYYRLKQTDFDGKYTYSEAVSLNNQNGKEVEVVYVSNSKLIIVSNSISASPVKAEIYSISGQRVYSGEFSTGVGNTISIPMNGQKQGLYILRLSNTVTSKVYKFVY